MVIFLVGCSVTLSVLRLYYIDVRMINECGAVSGVSIGREPKY
jgi:hypothetical protein